MLKTLLDFAPLVLWALLWIIGGCLLAASLFRLRSSEVTMVRLDWARIEIWLANVLAQTIALMIAFWLAAVLTLLGGLIAVIMLRRQNIKIDFPLSFGQWLILFVLTILFISVGRGLALFDDYQNLPTISLMATGDIPPHFALDPHFSFNFIICCYYLRLSSCVLVRCIHGPRWISRAG